MGVFDNELILPGTITEITSDYSLGYDTSLFGTTDSVTILGTAFNGPVGQAVPIYSPEHAAYVFGESYDYKTRREATLVAEIKNAWERGCRTIYAVRVSGKAIHKDFALLPETKLKLRVAGLFPSNSNKDIYMVYDNTDGAEMIKIYKPASRATMQEKLEGLVDKEDSILVAKIDLNGSYGLTKDSRLVELIKLVNEFGYNNVFRLSIVDENGADVTVSSKEAQALSVGAMFPGAYFIGRNVNKGQVSTDVQYRIVDEQSKPYESFEDVICKKLVLNTDVTSDFPIFAETLKALNEKWTGLVTMSTMFDFLEVPEKADVVFGKDKVDYEEVDISKFDLYKRLGSGFAITAKAEVEVKGGTTVIKKVKETPVSDSNRIAAIQDGIYSMLENLKSNYRVLGCGVADETISGKLPRKDDFKIVIAKSASLKDMVEVTPVIESKDFTDAKSYKFVISAIDPSALPTGEEIGEVLYTAKTAKAISVTTKAARDKVALPEGIIVANSTSDALFQVKGGVLVEVTGANFSNLKGSLLLINGTILEVKIDGSGTLTLESVTKVGLGTNASGDGYEYLLVEDNGLVFVYNIPGTDLADVVALGSVKEIFNENDDTTLVAIQSQYGVENTISIQSTEFDYITLEELVELLNEDENLKGRFAFKLTQAGMIEKDSIVEEVFDLSTAAYETVAAANKEAGVDTELYIPYKTNDNFARHLAQHCTYTSLKTAPTHGVIGCSKLMDVNLTSVAKKVEGVLDIDFNLYAKKPNGRDILDKNNLPYPIGRNISIVLGQYIVTTMDGYSYVSNSASGYAGMVSVLPLDQSSTNQPINIPTPMYELTNYQLGKLTQKGFVTFKQSYTQGFVVTDGITMAPVTSPFRRLSVARITNAVEQVIRTATEPFIGKQNHLANRNSMQTAIKSGLDSLKGKLIEAYEFKLQLDPAATKMGIVNIDYRLIPIYEIREVRNSITISDSL